MNTQSKLLAFAIAMAILGFATATYFKRAGAPAGAAAGLTLGAGTMIEPHRALPEFSLLDHHGAAF